MRQLHFDSAGSQTLRSFLVSIRDDIAGNPDAKPLFTLFSETADRSLIEHAIGDLLDVMPGAVYLGGSTGGNICDGAFIEAEEPRLTVVCNLFEDPATRAEVHQFPLDSSSAASTAGALIDLIAERPWVKAVGMLTTVIDVSMNDFRARLKDVPEGVEFFGGGVLTSENIDLFAGQPYVCSSDGAASGHSVVFVLLGGQNFHIATRTVIGWRPFGMPLSITKAEGSVLYEIDGMPAFERYRHYLAIENDENFAESSLIFPLMIEHNGRQVIKAPLKVEEDGSLVLTSDLADYHKQCRIAYGDPAIILRSIRQSAIAMKAFAPQGILAFSCAARLVYWGPDSVSRETLPFQAIAPTAGFYTGGEFSRDGNHLLHHNVTLVVTGMREGDAPEVLDGDDVEVNATEFTREMAIVHSLAAFVSVMSSELSDAYSRMEVMAKSDGLTGVNNRREIETLVGAEIDLYNTSRLARAARGDFSRAFEPPTIIMLDIDDFKVVNDAYGHKAGDDVLRGLGELLNRCLEEFGVGFAGRWGGEEFMIMLPKTSLADGADLAQRICDDFAAIDFPASGKHTLSLGVAQALPDETTDLLCQRVDKALYAAKKRGKNCVVVA